MTSDEILRMAREAGLGDYLWLDKEYSHGIGAMYELHDEKIMELMERFYALAVAHERLSCAKTAFLFGRTEAEALEIWNAIYKRDDV